MERHHFGHHVTDYGHLLLIVNCLFVVVLECDGDVTIVVGYDNMTVLVPDGTR